MIQKYDIIFINIMNVKHGSILFLIYSAGLPVGEVVRLKANDIDNGRMLIRIVHGREVQDRFCFIKCNITELRLHARVKSRVAGTSKLKGYRNIHTRSTKQYKENIRSPLDIKK